MATHDNSSCSKDIKEKILSTDAKDNADIEKKCPSTKDIEEEKAVNMGNNIVEKQEITKMTNNEKTTLPKKDDGGSGIKVRFENPYAKSVMQLQPVEESKK
jgi:hypothetical protein